MLKKMFAGLVAAFLGMVAMVGSAHAALDESIATGFTAIKTDALALNAIVLPIVVSLMGLFIILRLIKRFGNKV